MVDKTKIRKSPEWKKLRQILIERQNGLDPITGKKLRKGAAVHHLCQDPEQYDNLDPERFILINRETHECWHFMYGHTDKLKDWVKILDNFTKSFNKADEFN